MDIVQFFFTEQEHAAMLGLGGNEVDKTTSIGKIQLYTCSLEAGYMIPATYSNNKKVKLIYADLGEVLRKFFGN